MTQIPFKEALSVWVKIALNSFGGPTGQIAVMHKILVEEKKWLSENRFLHALNYCMLLPGPEAQQLATYAGYLLHGVRGGLVSGVLFILPGFVSILALSIAYSFYFDTVFVQGLFSGIKPAVLAIVTGALVKISAKALKNSVMYSIAFISFVCIAVFQIPFPYIIAAAGLAGFAGGILKEEKFLIIKMNETDDFIQLRDIPLPGIFQTVRTVLFWSALWLFPSALLYYFMGGENTFTKEALFFSKSAVVTFGGAYSVLAYIAQQAVETFHWLNPGEMLDGLGMAETTPGPLIQVVQFVGYMGAFRNPGELDPLFAGILGSMLVTWVTFVPCFLFIFSGAPYIHWLEGNKKFSTALSSITAAVVGVIGNLSFWFAVHLLFGETYTLPIGLRGMDVPVLSSVQMQPLAYSVLAGFVYLYMKISMIKTVMLFAALGIIHSLLAAHFL